MIDSFASRFEGARRKSNGGFLVRCPAHQDRQQSLSIDERDGKLYLKCFAGCDVPSILSAKGLTTADLRGDTSAPRSGKQSITVDSLAASKSLPLTALTKYGVRNVCDMSAGERLERGIGGTSGIWIPYYNLDGSINAKTRLRTAHVAKDGSSWVGGFGAILPYGLQELAEARSQGSICICEGETDFWTLREAGIPALGLPGANMVRALQRDHLAGIRAVYVCQDSDKAGVGFVASVRQHVAAWGIDLVCPLPMPSGCKDVNDLYRQDPKGFADRVVGMITAAAEAGAPKPREFSTAGEIYRLTVPEWGVRLELDQFKRSSWGDLTGELLISSELHGDLSRSTINLSAIDKRQAFAGTLAKRVPEVDWSGVIEDFALRALKAEREGRPSVNLRDVQPQDPDNTFEIDGVTLPRHHPSCLFGDGGTGKSYLALYWAGILTRQGVHCVYVDAELDAYEHRERLWRLFGDDFPPVEYLRLDRALERAVDQIRRLVRDKGIEFAIYDSVGVLTQGSPDSAEGANGYIRALRQIGIGSLSIAHITKNGEQNDQKPFGSVFFHNGFRSTWFAEQADPDAAEGQPLAVGLWNRKSNLSKRHQPVGLELDFLPNGTIIRRRDMEELSGLGHKQPIWRQIETVLRSGPQSPSDIAEDLGLDTRIVKATLSKGKRQGKFNTLERGIWALA